MIKIRISSSFYSPIHCVYAIVKSGNDILVIPNTTIIYTEWGLPIDDNLFVLINNDTTILIDIVWLSIFENKIYRYSSIIEENVVSKVNNLLVGCNLFGKVCIWDYKDNISEILLYDQGYCIDDEFEKLIDKKEYKIELTENASFNIDELCKLFKKILYNEYEIDSFDYIEIDDLMKSYSYRYSLVFEPDILETLKTTNNNKCPQLKYIEEVLYNGTFNKLHDNSLNKFHEGAVPQKIAVYWGIDKIEYIAYFWFEFDLITQIFEKFYGAHKDSKTDFIIRIDSKKKKYELALYRQGLKEPQIIHEDAYQLIVFKNKFEDYRSENYSQERGAWMW